MSRAKISEWAKKALAILTEGKKWLRERWGGISPGLRYAVIYFLSVVVIAGLVWWKFSPVDSLVFDPEAPKENSDEQEETNTAEEEKDPEIEPFVPLSAFAVGKETLARPLPGPLLLGFGQAFSNPRYSSVTGGIHLGGTSGDPVFAAFQGRVSKVIPPEGIYPGAVWVKHGDFETHYGNLSFVYVKLGDFVSTNQKLGELATDMWDLYSFDYLVYELWDAAGKSLDPLKYDGSGR